MNPIETKLAIHAACKKIGISGPFVKLYDNQAVVVIRNKYFDRVADVIAYDDTLQVIWQKLHTLNIAAASSPNNGMEEKKDINSLLGDDEPALPAELREDPRRDEVKPRGATMNRFFGEFAWDDHQQYYSPPRMKVNKDGKLEAPVIKPKLPNQPK